MDLLTWSLVRRARLKPDVYFDLTTHFFLRAIYESTDRVVVIYKASQMGASEYGISYSMHAADVRKATVLYVFPTDTHVSDFSSARIGPAIEASPYLNRIVSEGNSETETRRRGADRVTLKRVGDRFLYLRGSQVNPRGMAPQLKAIDADVLVLDEVDEMDPRAPDIAVKRLGHSTIAEERWISTPTYAAAGIHVKWIESDQREWHVRCQSCGEFQPLTVQQLVIEWDSLGRPAAWHESGGKPFIACRKCGCELNRLAHGEWVATYPEREIAGFHLTKLFSPVARLMGIIEALSTTDETKRREAFNQDLGEPYTPRGGQITAEILDACRRDYGHGPIEKEETFAGIDVGKLLHVVIRGPQEPETGERPQRFAGEVESFETLGNLLRTYHVRRAVVDALPETRKARELQSAFYPGMIWLAYYVTQKTGTKRAEPEQWDIDNGVVNLDRTRSLDRTYSRFFEGKNTLPAYARDVHDYYDHLKAPVRILEDGPGGEKIAQYVENAPDHFAHAENYCDVASSNPSAAILDYYKRKAAEAAEAQETKEVQVA
jgi:hypothetical protein